MDVKQQNVSRWPDAIACALKALITILSVALYHSMSYADFHFWTINEIYSNNDGSVQYIELITSVDGQTNLAGHTISAFHADGGGAPDPVFTFPSNLSGSTTQTTLLLANEGFELLTGLSPDYLLPENFIPTGGGSINFADVDTIAIVQVDMPLDGALPHGALPPMFVNHVRPTLREALGWQEA